MAQITTLDYKKMHHENEVAFGTIHIVCMHVRRPFDFSSAYWLQKWSTKSDNDVATKVKVTGVSDTFGPPCKLLTF